MHLLEGFVKNKKKSINFRKFPQQRLILVLSNKYRSEKNHCKDAFVTYFSSLISNINEQHYPDPATYFSSLHLQTDICLQVNQNKSPDRIVFVDF